MAEILEAKVLKPIAWVCGLLAALMVSVNQGYQAAANLSLVERTPIPTAPSAPGAEDARRWSQRGEVIDKVPEQLALVAQGVTDVAVSIRIMQRAIDDVRQDLRSHDNRVRQAQ